MKLRFLTVLIVFLAVIAQPALPQEASGPLGKDQVLDLVKFGLDSGELAKRIKGRGIDFEPTDDYFQTLRQAGAQEAVISALREARPRSLTREQVGQLVAGGVPSQRAVMLVKQHGIDFVADERYLQTLRVAGADDALIAALREASARVTAELVVTTSPNAEVLLDGQLAGRANPQGELEVKARPGTHALKVSMEGKKDFEQSVTLAPLQTTRIEAALVDAPGSIRLRTLFGASITLDGGSRGSADASGELVLTNISPGGHALRVSAPGKKEYRQSVTVLAGQENQLEVSLEILTAGTVQENPKDGLKYVWIPPGTFMMGCSPGDSECYDWEKPSHQVTITRGFWIGQTPVTVGAYKRFAGATGRQMPGAPGFNTGWADENMPIVNVSWDDSAAYCGWAGERLPTGAEWEYAARGGSTEARYGPIDEVAWYADNSGRLRLDCPRIWDSDREHYVQRLEDNGNGTHEVAQKRANGFGLYDMLGNVWEWVNDWFDANYHQNSPSQDPSGPTTGQYRVLRGGSWFNLSGGARVSESDTLGDPAVRYDGLGFRCGGEVFAP